MGPIGSKVIEVKGQIYVFLFVPPRSLGRSSPNLEGRWRAVPDISLRVSFFERSRSSRSKVKFMFFFLLFPNFSQVLGPIFTKLGGTYYNLSNVCLFVCLFVPLLLPGPWADLHQTWWEG